MFSMIKGGVFCLLQNENQSFWMAERRKRKPMAISGYLPSSRQSFNGQAGSLPPWAAVALAAGPAQCGRYQTARKLTPPMKATVISP